VQCIACCAHPAVSIFFCGVGSRRPEPESRKPSLSIMRAIMCDFFVTRFPQQPRVP
jgi:hypothetical protein